jgi:hypothetical protein
MAELSTAERKALPRSDFIFPDKAPGPGSYPAGDEAHARDALSRVEANGTEAERRHAIAWVKRRYPDMDVEAKP